MHAYCFFSVHISLFDAVARHLASDGYLSSLGGFSWGRSDAPTLRDSDVPYDPSSIIVFSEEVLARAAREPADLEWLTRREGQLGLSFRRAIAAERHLVHGRSYDDVLRLLQAGLRTIEENFDRKPPAFVFTEDISCLMSMLHWAVASERGIPFWCIGSARLPNRLSIYRSGFQAWERTRRRETQLAELSPSQQKWAEKFVDDFRNRPRRPTGMETRAKRPTSNLEDLKNLVRSARRYWADRDDPTSVPGIQAAGQRIRRIARVEAADAMSLFEGPVAGERYVLYPIHFQPEASTLVQAPMYLDQLALIEDIAKSLPIGVRLYVKEHLSNRGRRPLSFYRAIREICGTRLLGPDEDTWALIQGAEAVTVITGTMGWEALLYDKPAVVFGDVFYDHLPGVFRARDVPKDHWHRLFSDAIGSEPPPHDALHRFLVALDDSSFEGFMKNPNTFPAVLEKGNVRSIASALEAVIDEHRSTPAPLLAPHHLEGLGPFAR
ncbi:MAG: hypothetical protein CMN30_26820 [Sandaracinus sp.]|nr:hypothetical protein [Sandaracinus sp.]|tara:strand:+ start:404 stop:1885 length:1482 start_codon:yes stop_codon:yes gene_type:complete